MPNVAFDAADLLRDAPDALIAVDSDKCVLSMNRSATALVGIPESEAVGRPCADVLRSSLCSDGCPFEQVYADGTPAANFDVRVSNSRGETLPVCINSSVLRNDRGEKIGIIESVRDITHVLDHFSKREAAVREIRSLALRLEAVLETSSDAVVAVDDNCRVTSFNRAAEELTARPRGEVLGGHARAICEAEFCPLEDTLENRRAIPGAELNLKLRDGTSVPVWLKTEILTGAGGEVIGAVAIYRDQREVRRLREQFRESRGLDRLVGSSPPMQALYRRIKQVAQTDSTVLIYGESGTGKELVADIIHSRSSRWEKPFIKVHCAALPETLLESELFGHVRGAFTGAVADRPGRFELAHRGAIFLDEISELPPMVQVKLLRVLQERKFERLGGTQTISVDIRVLAATNRDLAEMVREGKFRQDLYYRLHVVPVDLPPLRQHLDDISLLADDFLTELATRNHTRTKRLTPNALKELMAHSWPGNVRELENTLEYAIVTSHDDWIRSEDLPPRFHVTTGGTSLESAIYSTEKELLLAALQQAPSTQEAARRLGISRATLWRKMKKAGVSIAKAKSQ